MRKMLWIFGVLLCAAALRADTVGKVLLMEGKADAIQAQQVRALALRAGVEQKDLVKTAAASSLQIGFRDSTTCTVGASTELSIEEYRYSRAQKDAAFHADLKEGSVRIATGKITRKAPRRFKITTPRASIGIRGCLLRVIAPSRNLGQDEIVDIFEIGKGGAIEIVSLDGKQKKTVTSPARVVIGEREIQVLPLPKDSYTQSNADYGIAQNSYGGDGSIQSIGQNLQTKDIQDALQENALADLDPTLLQERPEPERIPLIDSLIADARDQSLNLTSVGGSLSGSVDDPRLGMVSFTSPLDDGAFSARFSKEDVYVGGEIGFGTDVEGLSGVFSFSETATYDQIKNGSFRNSPGHASLQIGNDLLNSSSSSITFGSKGGRAIDFLNGSFRFINSSADVYYRSATINLNSGLRK